MRLPKDRMHKEYMNAYLDIETSFEQKITIIGIYFDDGNVVQMVGQEITAEKLSELLAGVETIYTYNGSRFDLPVIKKHLRIDLEELFNCHDLMHDCWACNLYGGLKKVEVQLGISRGSEGIDGVMAMKLWEDYIQNDNENSLKILLDYNKEDIINLKILRKNLKL